MLSAKGWLIHTADGKPDPGMAARMSSARIIDTTNPEAAKWLWEKIRDRYVKPYGFDYLWLDETEPDIDPAKDCLLHRIGNALLQCVSAFSHSVGVRGLPAGFWRQPQGDDSGAGGIPRSAAQRHGFLVERYRLHVGHAEALYSRGPELYRHRTCRTGTRISRDSSRRRFMRDYHAAHKPLIDGSDARDNVDEL